MTELIYLRDAQQRTFTATVSAVDQDAHRVELDATVFYVQGGGQPYDTGTLGWADASARVTSVARSGEVVWHTLEGPLPAPGTAVTGSIDWDRRYSLMRTHSAMHVLGGVVYQRYGVLCTGNNMDPLKARMDLEFDPLPEGFAAELTDAVNAEIAADRRIEVSFLPRDIALADEDLIRTKVNMIPESVSEIRVVDIVGLDKQADGGTHVRSTGEIGEFVITKTESKGKGNKRIRFELR
jgi:misacylated tRNA(Ala) deacylase